MYVPMLPLLVKSPKILGNYCLPWDLENIFFIYEPLKITVSALLILGKTWEGFGKLLPILAFGKMLSKIKYMS